MLSFQAVDPALLPALLAPASSVSSLNPTSSVPPLNTIPSNTTTKKKRTRRTKKQMALARDNDITNNGETAKTDNNPQFIHSDYENICAYVEDDEKFSELYGDTKTNVGPKVLTKTAAFNIFAIHINAHSNKRLNLTGRQLQQRVNYYIQKKYFPAKQWENQTGAGILDQDPHASLDEALEAKCPCYAKMDAIFGQRPNITPLAEFDSSNPTPIGPSQFEHQDQDSSPEVFYPGWDVSQSPPANQSPHLDADVRDETLQLMIPPLLCDGEDSDALPQSTLASFPALPVGANPTPGGVQFTPTPTAPCRTFPNQANSNETRPPKERVDKSKSSLATAYQSDKQSNEDRRFNWEKQQYDDERADVQKRLEAEEKMQQARLDAEEKKQSAQIEAAKRWISQGKSTTEVDVLLKAVFP
ncbi:uncharacterized protein PGTG_09952 [Puccinia graminis f. sp. tritici CRL 75-36-700-3]|uniref:Uncharacterized protein n=1 Tax=Puccinia graminis f. sp. tritici (strain CRL 75-36-700-3 / race SCCL) TaxID=418459 RepID=E3KFF7_PUCGT|nr:uncharacterized protein PGTG_09952 [Puccinia graminis f. sp. tritici CRL 75-36-700-3]EFP82984.2 hypothetical protein PGTG_09952 [Puccinia graminis f. sp. tritici CRL 75-36-700-3]